MQGDEAGSYEAFVDHLLYSAEQMLNVEAGWDYTFLTALQQHAVYICGSEADLADEEAVERLLGEFKASHCYSVSPCSVE